MTLPVENLSNVAVALRFPNPPTAHRVERVFTTVDKRTGRPVPPPEGWDPKRAMARPDAPAGTVAFPACDTSTTAQHYELMSSTAASRGAVPCTAAECFPGLDADQVDAEPATVDRTARNLGIRPGDEVWIAAARKAIEAHRTDGPLTGCGRATRTGERLTAADAIAQHQVAWCRKCWPKTTR